VAGITPSATVGPFFLFGLMPSTAGGTDLVTNNLVTPDAAGERIHIGGRVLDGDGVPLPDALIEIWQADAAGRYAHADAQGVRANTAFKGFGRSATDAEGRYGFETVRPGKVPGPNGTTQAPHIAVHVFARGMTRHAVTRIYFGDEAANDADPVLALVPAERRETLIAQHASGAYVFDIHLQGERETVFFQA
jgi:protocatechuate 3,4-dioxygenase alpha subunit